MPLPLSAHLGSAQVFRQADQSCNHQGCSWGGVTWWVSNLKNLMRKILKHLGQFYDYAHCALHLIYTIIYIYVYILMFFTHHMVPYTYTCFCVVSDR